MDTRSFLLQQMPYVLPQLLVYLIGGIVSLVYLRRYPAPATIVLIASVLLATASVSVPVAQALLIEQRGLSTHRNLMMLLGIGGSVIRAIGHGLVVLAAFIGRQPSPSDNGPALAQIAPESRR